MKFEKGYIVAIDQETTTGREIWIGIVKETPLECPIAGKYAIEVDNELTILYDEDQLRLATNFERVLYGAADKLSKELDIFKS